jgi:thioredoxin-dependent peroxiredoxin
MPSASKPSSKTAKKKVTPKPKAAAAAPSAASTKGPAAPASAGTRAPAFDLESDDGSQVSLADFKGKWLILYFYPKDNTPGCTREAQGFTAAAAQLAKLGATVVGVSKDSAKTHCGFKEKIGIGFPLLSDPTLATHRAYGAFGKKVMYGKAVEGVIRSTFLIGPDGKVAKAWRSVKVDGHVDAVLGVLREQLA